jgi:hypothetical protein
MAFTVLIDSDQLTSLHTLMLDFITFSLGLHDLHSDKGKEIAEVLRGVITSYLPVYMGNQFLFWSGRYWEERNPIVPGRIKSKDLINEDLENGVSTLAVFSYSQYE